MVKLSECKSGNKDWVKKRKSGNKDSVVYKIPCGRCEKAYFGETGRGLEARIKEHRSDLRNHKTSNAMVLHADQEGHLPNWNGAQVIHSDLKKTQRKLIEAAYILTEQVTNASSGFFKLHLSIAEQIKKEAKRECT